MSPLASFTRRQFAAVAAASFAAVRTAFGTDAPKRLRRSQSFFGLHFDLHPGPSDPALGRDVSDEMVAELLDATRPDFVQYDSKGHVGWLGWPSQVGPSAPHIVKDSIEIWRRVTAQRGVALYIHYSGVWDSEACRRHPEWARVGPDGKLDKNQTSTFGPYVDQVMIPQLREAATKYDLDGVWVDGECWATNPDYSPAAATVFRNKTGSGTLPKGPQEAGWQQWLDVNREAFRAYLRHYIQALKQTHPNFQIASNWLYSTFVPEEPSIPVDFLSGDFLGNASISTARLDARYLAQTGKSWDLMAWGFQDSGSNKVGAVHKPALQLEQEAAVVLAQGGGFQVYYNPSRAGWFEQSHVVTMGRLAKFCRARQAVSHQSESVPQIGVLFSKETLYATSGRLFGGWGSATDPARGCIDALVALQYSVDVLPDWKICRVAERYPLIVLPEWTAIGEAAHQTLLQYASAGGVLIVCGAENAALFAEAIGARVSADAASVQAAWIGGGEVLGNLHGLWRDLEPGSAQVLEQRFTDYDTRSGGLPAAVAGKHGKGEIVLIPAALGRVYAQTHTPAVRDFLRRIVAPRFQPPVRVSAPPVVEVALRTKAKRLHIHLLNSAGMQVAGDFAALDYIPAVGPVKLSFPWKPLSAKLTPEGTALSAVAAAGRWTIEAPKIEIHSVVTVEPPPGVML